jgi:hypothetical protein
MIQVTNTNSQLKITSSTLIEYYQYDTFKGISWALDSKGYYVVINFIANDKNNSLRLYMSDIDNQVSWTDTVTGVSQAVNDISGWMASTGTVNPVGEQRSPNFNRLSGTTSVISPSVNRISFSSVGTANATVNGVVLKPGETINFDAGDPTNYFPAGNFSYNTTTPGAELIVLWID